MRLNDAPCTGEQGQYQKCELQNTQGFQRTCSGDAQRPRGEEIHALLLREAGGHGMWCTPSFAFLSTRSNQVLHVEISACAKLLFLVMEQWTKRQASPQSTATTAVIDFDFRIVVWIDLKVIVRSSTSHCPDRLPAVVLGWQSPPPPHPPPRADHCQQRPGNSPRGKPQPR